ncbi:MAG TPA: hypothetical protein VGN11_10585 [Candidatus Baltobacteraceae bacterium]|jgi:hypothetical protein|nr:hypothetical protein [Candidatus Baltobacteraceae bacterium]
MNRFALALLALIAIAPFSVSAQTEPGAPASAVWTPSPKPMNPHEFNDPAMHFVAPSTWVLVGLRVIPIDQLGDDPGVVAGWSNPTTPQAIIISQQLFEGDASAFEVRFENDTRQKSDGVLIKSKQAMSLKNGMPAYFIDATYGSGFNTRKQFSVIWADGTRGVSITVTGRIGEIDADTAKKLLSDVSAVRYPTGRE